MCVGHFDPCLSSTHSSMSSATIVACPMSGFFEPLSIESSSKLKPDPRAMVALSRVNWLHSRYEIVGATWSYQYVDWRMRRRTVTFYIPLLCLFSNPRYAFTLSIYFFIGWRHGRRQRWAELYGWRPLSPLEQYVSENMFLSCIVSSRYSPSVLLHLLGWDRQKDGYPRYTFIAGGNEIMAWCTHTSLYLETIKSTNLQQVYEGKHMVPAQTNYDVASLTMDELLHIVPAFFNFRTFARKLALCILEEPVRISMMLLNFFLCAKPNSLIGR
jgi:hypothetical protein